MNKSGFHFAENETFLQKMKQGRGKALREICKVVLGICSSKTSVRYKGKYCDVLPADAFSQK